MSAGPSQWISNLDFSLIPTVVRTVSGGWTLLGLRGGRTEVPFLILTPSFSGCQSPPPTPTYEVPTSGVSSDPKNRTVVVLRVSPKILTSADLVPFPESLRLFFSNIYFPGISGLEKTLDEFRLKLHYKKLIFLSSPVEFWCTSFGQTVQQKVYVMMK